MYMTSVNFSSIIEKVNYVNYLIMTKKFMPIPVQELGELHNQTYMNVKTQLTHAWNLQKVIAYMMKVIFWRMSLSPR